MGRTRALEGKRKVSVLQLRAADKKVLCPQGSVGSWHFVKETVAGEELYLNLEKKSRGSGPKGIKGGGKTRNSRKKEN